MTSKKGMRMKYIITICLSLAFMSVGLFIAMIGPTLPTLANNLHATINSLSYVITARGFGYLIGSIISGLIFEKANVYIMMFGALSITTIGSIAAPLVNYIWLLALTLSTAGLAMGFLDTAGNVLCLQTWGDKSGPYMQTLHFFFAVGTTLSPFISMPFIMDTNSSRLTHLSKLNATDLNQTLHNVSKNFNDSSHSFLPRHNDVTYAFVISAVICLLVAISFLLLAFLHKSMDSSTSQKDTIEKEGKLFRIKMLILLFFFFLVYVGTEVTFGVYIYTFAVNCQKHYSKTWASGLNSVFWGAFAIGRFFAIPLSKIFQPAKLLIGDLFGTIIAVIMFVCFPLYVDSADFLLWIGIAIYGFSMASIFPSGISWAEEYITVTGKAAMVLVVGASSGEMICPMLVGQFIELNPMNLMYFTLLAVSLSTINLFTLFKLASRKGKRMNKSTENKQEEMAYLMDSSDSDIL